MSQVTENMQVENPEAMIDFEAEQMVNEMAQRITSQGLSFEQYMTMTGMKHGHDEVPGYGACGQPGAP